MDYLEAAPPSSLSRWIRVFWRLRGDALGVQPVVPDGRMEIILHLADRFHEIDAEGIRTAQDTVLVAGQLTRPLLLAAGDTADVIGIRFRTAGARAILGIPLDALRDRVVALDLVDRSLAEALRDAAHRPAPFDAIARVLQTRLGDAPLAATHHAVARLDAGASVAGVARELGVSTRTLERRVAADTGLSPKVLQRVLRFRRFYALQQDGITGSRAALVAGYYDQSHAERDFRVFTGTAPTRHFGEAPTLASTLLSHSS